MRHVRVSDATFQFTHPGRGATAKSFCWHQQKQVSIHAPREGCDLCAQLDLLFVPWFQFTHPGRGATLHSASVREPRGCFNSRTPGGVRRSVDSRPSKWTEFQFTHPGRGATKIISAISFTLWVSIHAPREGCDAVFCVVVGGVLNVSIHAPREGCDTGGECTEEERPVSIHAPREGCDPLLEDLGCGCEMFQFTHPGRGATV